MPGLRSPLPTPRSWRRSWELKFEGSPSAIRGKGPLYCGWIVYMEARCRLQLSAWHLLVLTNAFSLEGPWLCAGIQELGASETHVTQPSVPWRAGCLALVGLPQARPLFSSLPQWGSGQRPPPCTQRPDSREPVQGVRPSLGAVGSTETSPGSALRAKPSGADDQGSPRHPETHLRALL